MGAARAPEALPLGPASAGCCAQSSLTLSDLSQIAPVFTSSNRSSDSHQDNTREVCFQDAGIFIVPREACNPLVRLQFFISFGENRKTEA